MRSIRAITVGGLAAGALLAVCASPAPALADWHHGGGWRGPGFGVAIGPAYYPPAYYAPPPVYYAPPPAYYAPPPPVYIAPPAIAFGVHIR